MVGQHPFPNIIPNNFTVGTGRKVRCDRGMRVPTFFCPMCVVGEPCLTEELVGFGMVLFNGHLLGEGVKVVLVFNSRET